MSKNLKFTAVIVLALVVLEGLASLGIVAYAAWSGRDYRAVAMELHVPRLVVPLIVGPHPLERAIPARFLGRYSGLVARQLHLADGLLGWRPAPSVSVYDSMKEDRFAISEFAHGKTALYPWRFTNAQGFFSSGDLTFDYPIPKPAKTFRIIILGGSTVAGDWSESHKDTLPAKLLAQLRKLVSRRGLDGFDKLELINAGVGGYDSAQEYLYLLGDLWAYQANLILTYDGWNDFQGYNKGNIDPIVGQQPFRSDSHKSNDRRLRDSYTLAGSARIFAQDIFAAAVDFARGFSVPFVMDKIVEHATYKNPANDMRRTMADGLETFLERRAKNYFDNIRRSLRLADANNAAYAAFLQPLFGVDNKTYVGWEKRYVDNNAERLAAIRKFYKQAGAFYRQLAAAEEKPGRVCIADISGTALQGVTERAYSDHGHLLGVGNAAAAKAIIAELDRCRMIPWRS